MPEWIGDTDHELVRAARQRHARDEAAIVVDLRSGIVQRDRVTRTREALHDQVLVSHRYAFRRQFEDHRRHGFDRYNRFAIDTGRRVHVQIRVAREAGGIPDTDDEVIAARPQCERQFEGAVGRDWNRGVVDLHDITRIRASAEAVCVICVRPIRCR